MHLNAFRVEIPPAALPADVAEVHVGDVRDGHGGHGHRGHECGGGGECGHAHHHHHSLPNAGERESAASTTSHSPPARDSFAEAMTAAMAASASGVGAGTALYGAPSLLNHSCDPNVDVSWAIDSRASFRAARAIEKDEPLTVAYVDADAGVAARREKLAFAYGFECRCERCVEETSAVQ